MSNIKFGLKLWSKNYDSVSEAQRLIEEDIFQYIELMVVPDTEISPFQKIKAPYIIHMSHEDLGTNIADKKKKESSQKIIKQCIEWADKLNADYLVLHPGFGSISDTLEFLEKINDERILVENMPKIGQNGEKMIGFTPEQIKELMGDKFGFCLDFSHAIKAAISLKKDYKKYIEDFLKLNPKIFHIYDGNLNNEKDEHLNIKEGEFDFAFLANCIRGNNSKLVTLETPRTNLNSLKEDLENMEKLKSILFL